MVDATLVLVSDLLQLDQNDQIGDDILIMARTYPVYEAKAKLSEILRSVKRGKPVTISERGKPVATIIPLCQSDDIEGRLAELQHAGMIQEAKRAVGQVRTIARKPGALRRFLRTRE